MGGWYALYTNPEMSGWAKPSNTIHDPQSYQFVDISNNNAQRGEMHYKTSLFVRDHVLFSKHPRPPYGLGLNHVALHHIQSMRLLTGEMDFFRHDPAIHLLGDREENEAYCLAIEGEEYAVYFTGKGNVTLNTPPGRYAMKWLQVRTSQWSESITVNLPGELKNPSDDQWVVLIRPVE